MDEISDGVCIAVCSLKATNHYFIERFYNLHWIASPILILGGLQTGHMGRLGECHTASD